MVKKPKPDEQRDFLFAVKNEVSMEWDQLAEASGIAPRAFKTYRMPASSKNRRGMSGPVRAAVAGVLETYRKRKRKKA